VAGRVGRVAEGQGQAVGLRAGDAQVTTGVDHRVPGTLPQQGVDGAIHSVSLGNAAQVDPQGAVEAHPVVVEEFDVAPACVGIGVGSVGAGQGAVMHELRGHGGSALRPTQPQAARRGEHRPSVRADRGGLTMGFPVEAGELAVCCVKAQAAWMAAISA
jgi:hypothetical protein